MMIDTKIKPETTNNRFLAVSDIELSFGGLKSLDKVSFQAKEGEVLSIIGPNGAGKTCLLNCVSGYYRPQKGKIFFQNSDLTHQKAFQIARMGIGRTFQSPALYPQLTALENLLVARHIHTRTNLVESLLFFGKSRREEMTSLQVIEEIISLTHIEELRKRPVMMMSYGQRKQVEIARALVLQPRLLLLDEPMSGLDEMMKEIMAELILKVQSMGMTVILIEHDIEVVMGLSQSVVVLDFGQKIAEGTPQQVVSDPRVIEAYLGTESRQFTSDSPHPGIASH